MNTSAKNFGLAVGPRPGNTSQNGQKPTSLMLLTKKRKSKTKNHFFHCRLEDLLNLLRVWTAL